MYTPSAHRLLCRHDIHCPRCNESPFYFHAVPAEDLPRTNEEYGEKVMELEEVMLYGMKEEAS